MIVYQLNPVIENLKTKVSKDIVYVDDGNGKMIPVEITETIYYNPEFDSILKWKVSKPALVADSETFLLFMIARYTVYFLVLEQIFFILAIGIICLEVQNPKASCKSSVNSVRV